MPTTIKLKMFKISFNFTTVDFILGSQNKGTRLFHFHFWQFLLFPPSLRLALENSVFELQKLRVRLTSKQEKKKPKPQFQEDTPIPLPFHSFLSSSSTIFNSSKSTCFGSDFAVTGTLQREGQVKL